MRYYYFLILFCLLCSCQFFQMERQTSEYILQEELKTINWHEVDVYPIFSDCKALDQDEQPDCFIEILHQKITNSIQRYAYEYSKPDFKELKFTIQVDKENKLDFNMDTLTVGFESDESYQIFKNYIQEGLDSIQVIEPALKRGIPVTTKFELPVLFIKENQ